MKMSIEVTARLEQILGYILPGIGVVLTSCRLLIRNRYAHFGLDDLAIFIAALAQVALMIATNLYTSDSIHSRPWKALFFYCMGSSYYLIIWGSRLSILLSIGRIAPTYRAIRLCRLASIGYIIIWVGLNIQYIIVCERDTTWKHYDPPHCPLGRSIAFTQLAVDILGDSVIIIVPARFFWRSSLPLHKRLRLIAVFATSIVTTILGFSHIYFILNGPPLAESLNGIIQCSVSVIVCNLPVVLSTLIIFCKRSSDSSQSQKAESPDLGSSVQFAGINTLEGRSHHSHISGLTGLTNLTHITTQDSISSRPNTSITAVEAKSSNASTDASHSTLQNEQEVEDLEKQGSQNEVPSTGAV